MDKKIEDYLHLYFGCEVFDSFKLDGKEYSQTIKLSVSNFQWVCDCIVGGRHRLILRPLSDMTEEEVLELCKTASPVIFGDYRFAKWEVERSPHEICHWTVTNKNSIDYFNISSTDGDVDIYAKDGQPDPTNIDNNYRFWYLKKGFDLFGLIDAGLAIDKTKL